MKIIIPARLGSKGLPFKNRILLEHTLNSIPQEKKKQVWVTTDDPLIKEEALRFGVNLIDRPTSLAEDETSVRDVMVHAIGQIGAQRDEIITVLYLTYPERTWEQVEAALLFFLEWRQLSKASSLLCKKEPKTHPFLCLQEHGADGIFGRQLVHHDLYRRQDYPKVFEISHFISIFIAGEIHNLNRNLYCESTVFYPIHDVIDVDTKKELEEFNGK